jgi:hypothetical protein
MFQLHESTRLTPPHTNEPIEIDNDMVPLVRALWARGWRTLACCQDDGEAVDAERAQGRRNEPTGHRGFIEYHKGWAWLKIPVADTLSMLTELSEHETFGPRVKIRWQRGSWRTHIPVIYQDGHLGPAPYAQIYFPKEQIAELTAAMTALGGIAS